MRKYTLLIAAFICTCCTNARQPRNAENVHSLIGAWIKKLQFEVTENDKQIRKINNSKAPYLPLPFLRDCRQFFAAIPLSRFIADT
jgi:hypothetical protein